MRRQLQYKRFTMQMWNELSSLPIGYYCVQEIRNNAPIGKVKIIYDRGVTTSRYSLYLNERPGRKNDRAFLYTCFPGGKSKSSMMKLIVMIFLFRFAIELIQKIIKKED